MNAIKRNRLLVVLAALVVLGSGSVVAQTGRLELNVPDFDMFTPTDWIDAATFTLKESIPAGVSGTIFTSQVLNVYLEGRVLKQTSGDPFPIELATFYISAHTPIRVTQPRGNEFAYEMSIGSLSKGTEFDVTYRENTPEVDKLKDQLTEGIAAITGKFTLEVKLRMTDPQTGPVLDQFVRVFDIPFSSTAQAKISIQVDPVVALPNPSITVVLPPERPQLEYEIAVYRVEDNPRDAVLNGRPLWKERITDGRTILIYPQSATPLITGKRYVVAGKSLIQTSANQDKVTVDADLVTFQYVEPSGNQPAAAGGGGQPNPGQDANRPDPLLTIFGNVATQVPPALAAHLTNALRQLETRGWTFTQVRYNNRVVTAAELAQLLEQFANATVTVVE